MGTPGQDECYVAGGLATVLRLSRLGGLAPLTFQRKGLGWRVSLSPAWTYYGYFIVTVIMVTAVGGLAADFQLPAEQSVRMRSSTRRAVWASDLACMLLIAATGVYGAPAHMRDTIATINRIEKINFELNIRHWPMHSERKKTRFFLFWLLLTVVLTVVDFAMTIGEGPMNQEQVLITGMYSLYYCCYWMLQLRELNFVMSALHAMYCLRSVNDRLNTLLRELGDVEELPLITLYNRNFSNGPRGTKIKPSKVNVNIIADYKKHRAESHQETVRRLSLAHARSCDVVRELDASHGLIVLMLLGSFLLHLVCTPYYVINCLIKDDEYLDMSGKRSTYYIGLQLVWCFYHAVNLLMVIEPCHLTQVEMETTCDLVSHLIRCSTSTHDPLGMELDMFFKHLFLNKASYSAMHVTTISRSLVATILGSITTYLVIIIQLQ